MSASIIDRCLWMPSGMEARATLYPWPLGPDMMFELFLGHGGAVPVRYRGSLGMMMNMLEHWTAARVREGFEMQAEDGVTREGAL